MKSISRPRNPNSTVPSCEKVLCSLELTVSEADPELKVLGVDLELKVSGVDLELKVSGVDLELKAPGAEPNDSPEDRLATFLR